MMSQYKKACLMSLFFFFSAVSQASVLYEFNFTNLVGVKDGSGDDFSLSLIYDDYVTNTGMQPLVSKKKDTTLGYSVAYAGTNNIGWWGFDDDNNSTLTDNGFNYGGLSFLVSFSSYSDKYFSTAGTYSGGRVNGNAPYSFSGKSTLTISEFVSVPEPSPLVLFGIGLIGLIYSRKIK